MIERTPVSEQARRRAQAMASAASRGEAGMKFGELCRLAVANPRATAELIIALAEKAVEYAQRPVGGPYPATYQDYMREAHAAYVRGERSDWVVEGERAYQRARGRRRRSKGAA